MENRYFTNWEIIKFFKWFIKNKKINLKIKLSINSSFANHWSHSTQHYILFSKTVKNFDVCQSFRSFNLSEPWALVIFGCRLTDHSDFYAVREYNFYAFSYRHSQFWICFFIIIHWLMNWLLRQWGFRISISLIKDIWIVLSLKIPRSAVFCSGNFSFSALLFHKLLFQGIKISGFDISVYKNLYEFRVVS